MPTYDDTEEMTPMSQEDKHQMLQVAMAVSQAIQGKPMMHGWLALMLNAQSLGRDMIAHTSTEFLKAQLYRTLELIDRWIVTYRKQ